MDFETPEVCNQPVLKGGGLDLVYRTSLPYIRSALVRYKVPASDIEDAAHEAFLVVLRRIADFRGDSSITTWIYSIAKRVALSSHRKKKMRDHKLEGWTGWSNELSETEESGTPEFKLEIDGKLDALDRETREAILLKAQGYSVREIGELMGINQNTIATRLRATKKKFCQERLADRIDGN